MKIDEKVLFSLTQLDNLLTSFYNSYVEVGLKGFNKDDAKFIKDNLFLIKINVFFMKTLKDEYFIRYSNDLQGLSSKTVNPGIKILALVTLKNFIPRICYMIYHNPSSDLTKNLIKNKVLVSYFDTAGEIYVKINWKEYVSLISDIIEDIKSLLESKKTGGDKNESVSNNGTGE